MDARPGDVDPAPDPARGARRTGCLLSRDPSHRRRGVLAGLAAAGFLVVLADVLLGGPLVWLDETIRHLVGPVRPGGATAVAEAMARSGHWLLQGGFLLVVTAAVSVVRRTPGPVVAALVGLLLVGVVGVATKLTVARTSPRTGVDLVFADGSAWPSGHTAGAVVVGLMLAWLLRPHPTSVAPAPVRVARDLLRLACVCWPLLMGWSRVHLGVHWTSDVVAGCLLGVAAVLIASLVATATRGRRLSNLFWGPVDQTRRAPH